VTDRVITEVDELKAVTHPLRVRMLGALREHGPATATELARRFATDTGSTSYHLRTLARYGFVEQAPEQRDSRERRWRAVHATTSWDTGALSQTEEGRAVVGLMRRRQLDWLRRAVEEYEAVEDALPASWRAAAGMSDAIVRLSPAGVARLEERIEAVLDEVVAEDAGSDDARSCAVFYGAVPRPEDAGGDGKPR
jgi:DNA-binding transcriptional ArsR family regulator